MIQCSQAGPSRGTGGMLFHRREEGSIFGEVQVPLKDSEGSKGSGINSGLVADAEGNSEWGSTRDWVLA